MKTDFETKINDLEAKIEKLESRQDTVVEGKVFQIRAELKDEIKRENFQIEYVGRHNALVGDGGILIKNQHGFGNVSMGGYADMEYHDLDGSESSFRQHRRIINLAA